MSFGGFPTVLPNVHELAAANGWLTDREFADIFGVSQVMPGPNMILMMSFIGLKLGGISGAIATALATFGPPCAMYDLSYALWDRFREMPWQRTVRHAIAPLRLGKEKTENIPREYFTNKANNFDILELRLARI